MSERKWKSIHREVRLLSFVLSFTFLAVVWIMLGLIKFRLYGINGWGFHWRLPPTTWDNVKAFWDFHLRPSALWMMLGCAADCFFWPYFLRKENKLEFHYED